MRTRLRLELLEGREVPAATLDQPAEAFAFVLINQLRQDPAGFADRLDGLRRGTVDSAFGFGKSDPVVSDLRRLIQLSTWPGHYAHAIQTLRSSAAPGPLGWDDVLADRAGVHNDWMRTHSFEHTGQDALHKSYIPGFNSGYRGGSPDAWGYEPGRYYWWGEDIGYTYGLMAASKAAYTAGRIGRIGFQERAAFIDTLSYILEVNSPDMAHLHQLLAPDGGPATDQPQFNAIGMGLDFYEGPFEAHDGLGEATISTHRFGLYRPGESGGFLSGIAFRDGNGNGVYDAGEGMGVTVTVSGPVSFTDTLDRLGTQGVYSRYLPDGTYSVSAVSADGWSLGSRIVTINDRNAWFEFRAAGSIATPAGAAVTAPVGAAGVRPTVTWTEVPYAVGYQILLTNRTTGRVSVFPGATTSVQSWTPPADLVPGHAYRVVVRPLLADRDGPWSPAWDFSVGTSRPVVPGANVPALRPSVSWEGLPGAMAYEIRLVDVSSGQIVFMSQRTTSTSWAPPADLVSGRNYAVRVRAVNSLGLGLWGPVETFSIATPTLSGPVGTIGAQLPTFDWSAIAGASRYVIALDDVTTGRHVVTTSVAGTSWQPPTALAAAHAYRWRVAAYNAAGLGRWSAPSEFDVTL